MTYDEFLNFLDQFEEIQSFRQKIIYANQNLQKIGAGSGRIVYDIDGTKVFKFAKNAKGVAQNDAEVNIGSYEDTHHIVTKVLESDNNGSWLVAEKAKKVSEARIKQVTGIPSLTDLYYFLRNHENVIKGGGNIFSQDKDIAEFLRNNEFAVDLEDIMGNYSISAGDLNRASTFGEVLRNGQPTIVLADYGLTDEVYNTHYSPQRKKQYQMYEMFNCADGNDDILSDMPPQDAVDTRRGMWAQMPYDVSDGGGVINEGFISFVLARDKYPKKLPSAPYVLDEFHNVVNNLKEVLKRVPEKKKFYNNLLTLQEWLIEQKLYDRDPLLKEEYEINEVGSKPAVQPFTLEDKNYATELASAFAKKINLGVEPVYLAGGSNGHAFTLNTNVILKITADRSEAYAAGKLLNEEPKYISKIYSFYKIIDTEKQLAFFAILQENIQDKPTAEFFRHMKIIDSIEPAGLNYIDILMKMRKALPAETTEIAKHIITDKPEIQISAEERETTYDYMIDLINIQEELYKFGIKSDDYGNPENLGYHNGVLKFFDVGGYKAPEPAMMAQDIVYLPEDGSAKFSTDNAMGQDNFPAHNNIDNSPSIQNDLNTNINIEEDLEYNHVDDATKDEYLMSERKLSSMEGSSTVDVKQKCRLAGNGNTSTACNQGDINNLNIKPLKEEINEEVNAKEMRSDIAAIKSILNGKRGVAFVEINKEIAQKLEKKKIGVIPTRMTSRLTMMAIIFTDKVKAYLLYDFAKNNEGYLKDKTPEEAREIGKLLDYTPSDIEDHIRNKYGSKVPVLPERSPDDFDDLAEEVAYDFWDLNEEDHSEFEKNIEQDLTTHQLDKKFIRNYQDGDHTYSVFAVNGDQVRDSGFIEWVDGGNHWVDADLPEDEQKYAKHIGENEYWIDDVFMIKPDDFEAILLHERTESFIIRHYGYEYDDAHEIANKIEMMFRKNIPNGANRAVAEKIYDTFVKNFKPEKSKQKHEPANESIEMLNEAQIMGLNYLPFREDVEEAGGKIYSVGGAVRDEFLGKESKDLDILITGVPFEQLEQILGKYGAVNAVGKSFGVLKFKPKGATEDIDIAIPRTETPTGEGGHQGFDVKSDHSLPIEKDLERRDFTINAIAKDIDGNIVDPFGGQEDLKNKVIKVVNPQAFSDDPLRMLRAVQFASRFGFTIEPETMKMIQENAGRVKEIAPERILTEFDKIVKKGNVLTGAILLDETGLLREIFGKGLYYDFRNTKEPFDKVRTMGEFVYLLSKNLVNDPAEFYKTNLKGDENAYREIKALQIAFESGEATNLIEARSIAHNMYVISPTSLQSQILPNVIQTAAQELLQGKYPKTVNELAVNGNDLMQAGLQGKAIGDMQKSLLLKIYANKAMNDKEELLSLAKQEKPMIKEEKAPERIEYGCLMLFLDVPIWSKITSIIDKNDIYDKEGYGIENEPHTTILYGFHDEVTAEEVFNLYKEN